MKEERLGYRITKRTLDLVLGGLLSLCLLPFMVLIGLAIRLDSKGPALFKQQRIGHGGRPFMIVKFRTMVVHAPDFGVKPHSAQDGRVTGIGRFLRTSSLDELPQLINVLKGEMSLVGPRPEQAFLVERYQPWQRERFCVLPGMTGWWQVNGRKQPMHDYVEEDLYYIRHRSLWLDLVILARTAGAVWAGKGAV